MTNTQIIAALSQDLYRVATGYNRGSIEMAERFAENAMELSLQLDHKTLKPHIQRVIKRLPGVLSQHNTQLLSEEALTLSIILRNYAMVAK